MSATPTNSPNDHVTNVDVVSQTGQKEELASHISRRRTCMTVCGHVRRLLEKAPGQVGWHYTAG